MTTVNVGGKNIPLVIAKHDKTIATMAPGQKYGPASASALFLLKSSGQHGNTTFADEITGMSLINVGASDSTTVPSPINATSIAMTAAQFVHAELGSISDEVLNFANGNSWTIDFFYYQIAGAASNNVWFDFNNGNYITMQDNGNLLAYPGNATSYITCGAANTPLEGEWNHYAMEVVRGETDQVAYVYREGAVIGTVNFPLGAAGQLTKFDIGHYINTSMGFHGYIDMFRIRGEAAYGGEAFTVPTSISDY